MNTPLIVAVASDAGDLEAVCELLSALPPECDAAFIIVQQLDVAREKLLATTLAKRTKLPVLRALDGVLPEARHVYVIGAHDTLSVSAGRIRVAAGKTGGLRNPGDFLFAALAEERGAEAIGVVLSGAGSDGALGIRVLKARGGVTFAQYPGSARFPSMPISAIETGCVGKVLRPFEIAIELSRLSHPAPALAVAAPRALAAEVKAGLPPRHVAAARSSINS
jgi:two-component system, chemotaxis family, CheB/CheR fusion protein